MVALFAATAAAVMACAPVAVWGVALPREALTPERHVQNPDQFPDCPADQCDANMYYCDSFDWREAALEEGLDPDSISVFGRTAPKFKRSDVERVLALNHSKVYPFNFVGSLGYQHRYDHQMDVDYHRRRDWILPYVEENFGKNDFLVVSDANPDYVSRGIFDHTGSEKALRMKSAGDKPIKLWSEVTPEYLEVMAQSHYTLCPGGDAPWSIRSIEAIATGTIPVIRDPVEDWRPADYIRSGRHVLQAILDKVHYVRLDDLPIADFPHEKVTENLDTFLKYMTFMQGDNVIPELKPCSCPKCKVSMNPHL